MADKINIVEFFFVRVGDRPGEANRLLEHISVSGLSLMAYAAYPHGEDQTQLNFFTDRVDKLKEAVADAGEELQGPQKAFLIQGDDRIGALSEHLLALAHAGVNVPASSGVCDGTGRFGIVLWVDPKDFQKAAWAFDFV